MTHRSEIMLPCGNATEAVTLFDIAKMIPLEEQVELRNFLRGTRYGLDMAAALHRKAQTETPPLH